MTQFYRAYEFGAAKGIGDHLAALEPTPKRIRVTFSDEIVADSTNALIMYETRHQPVYYFPEADVRMDLLEKTDHSTH